MAKKFVRGVTGIEDIESYDKTLTNVNDILSDGQDTFVHTKKGKNESYYKLTDSVKQVESTDNLLKITKDDGTVSISNTGLATKQDIINKQDTLQSSISIAVSRGQWLRQLYTKAHTYTVTNGVLKTHVKSLAVSTNPDSPNDEYNFIVKINKGAKNIVVTLNEDDMNAFTKIMSAYGSNNTVSISGCIFTLSGSSLTIETSNNTNQNYVITFSYILW